MKKEYQVTENNGGGITLYYWEDDKLIYAHSGYEYGPASQLLEDIEKLNAGEDPREWEGNDLEDIERIVDRRTTISNESGQLVLPEDDKVYHHDGSIILLTHDEYYDDHPSTRVIYDSTDDNPVCDSNEMGRSGQRIFYPELS